jgi:hypothetical protein
LLDKGRRLADGQHRQARRGLDHRRLTLLVGFGHVELLAIGQLIELEDAAHAQLRPCTLRPS